MTNLDSQQSLFTEDDMKISYDQLNTLNMKLEEENESLLNYISKLEKDYYRLKDRFDILKHHLTQVDLFSDKIKDLTIILESDLLSI